MVRLFRRSREKDSKVAVAEEQTKPDVVRKLSEGDDALYEALSYLLLLNPERLLQTKTIDTYIKESKEGLDKRDKTKARIAIETATRLAIYQGETAKVRSLLPRCVELAETPERVRIYEVTERKLDRIFSAARNYYEGRPRPSA